MGNENAVVVQEFEALVVALKKLPGATARLKVRPPVPQEKAQPYADVLAPELIEFAQVANGFSFEWALDGVTQGRFEFPTLAQFAKDLSTYGVETTDDEKVQRLNRESDGNCFALFLGTSSGLVFFDGDYTREATVGTIADYLRAGIAAKFTGAWEDDLVVN